MTTRTLRTSERNDHPEPSPALPFEPIPAALSFLLPLFLYFASMAPSVTLEDSGEFLTAATHLGIPHPPGYPLWCLLAHPFTWIPLGAVAERVHFFSALCGAGTCFMVQRIGHRLSGSAWGGLAAALTLAVTRSLWSQSTIAEVYALNALFMSIALWSALSFVDHPKPLYFQILLGAIGFGAADHHLAPYLALPLLLWTILAHPKIVIRPGTWGPALLLFAIGLSVYAYLPIRAASKPVPNVGDPRTWQATLDHVLRTTYSTGVERIRQAESWTDAARHAWSAIKGHSYPLWLAALLALVPLAPKRWGYVLVGAAIIFLNDVLLKYLINDRFNDGWEFVHRVYGIPSDLILATFVSGFFVVAPAWSAKPRTVLTYAISVFLIASLVFMNFSHGYRRNDLTADRVGRAVLDSLPSRAGVIVADDFIYVLLYLTQIEKIHPDVALLRPEFGYDPKSGYSTLYSVVPSSPALEKELASLGRIRLVPAGLVYRVERVNAATPPVDPKNFAEIADPPTSLPPAADPNDVFHRFACGLVSNYWAEVGNKRWAEGKTEEANRAWDLAESFAATTIADLKLVSIYRSRSVRPEKIEPLLQSALEKHDRTFDPASSRYLYVDRDEITRQLSQIKASSP